MTVRVAEKNLLGSIWSEATWFVLNVVRLQMRFPFVHVIDEQGVVVTAATSDSHRFLTPTDQVQFLDFPQLEPRAGKIEVRSRQGVQLQDVFIELATCRDVRHVQGDMIQFEKTHAEIPFARTIVVRPSFVTHVAIHVDDLGTTEMARECARS